MNQDFFPDFPVSMSSRRDLCVGDGPEQWAEEDAAKNEEMEREWAAEANTYVDIPHSDDEAEYQADAEFKVWTSAELHERIDDLRGMGRYAMFDEHVANEVNRAEAELARRTEAAK
jgi:hypothetical protein